MSESLPSLVQRVVQQTPSWHRTSSGELEHAPRQLTAREAVPCELALSPAF